MVARTARESGAGIDGSREGSYKTNGEHGKRRSTGRCGHAKRRQEVWPHGCSVRTAAATMGHAVAVEPQPETDCCPHDAFQISFALPVASHRRKRQFSPRQHRSATESPFPTASGDDRHHRREHDVCAVGSTEIDTALSRPTSANAAGGTGSQRSSLSSHSRQRRPLLHAARLAMRHHTNPLAIRAGGS